MVNKMETLQMPNNIELEKSILGEILNYPEKLNEAVQFINEKSFYDYRNNYIFNTILEMDKKNIPIDLISLTNYINCNNKKFAEFHYISTLIDLNLKHSIEYYCMQLAEIGIRRQMLISFSLTINELQNESIDLLEITDRIEKTLTETLNPVKSQSYQHVSKIADDFIKNIDKVQNSNDSLLGLSTGFESFDKMINGLCAPDVIIIAARPSMGKTAFVGNILANIVKSSKSAALFSLEMSSTQILNRIMISESGIQNVGKSKLNQYEYNKLNEEISIFCTNNLYIDDTPAITLNELRSKSRILKAKHKIQLIVIDYIQLMKTNSVGRSREQEVSEISAGIKAIAKELDIPIIALSQLNRSCESRTDKRPQLSDLRETGAIEQDADIVCFINRPERYGIMEDSEGNSLVGIAEIIFAKNRNGKIDNIQMNFKGEEFKFTELSRNVENINSWI